MHTYAASTQLVSPSVPPILHTASDLTLIGCDDLTGIAVFQADSHHDVSRVNTVALDTVTGAIICGCKGDEFGRVCWHQRLVVAAWHNTPAMRSCRWLSPVALINAGRKSAAMVATYRQRIGRPLQDDVTALVAARSEWRRREAVALVGAEALPLAA